MTDAIVQILLLALGCCLTLLGTVLVMQFKGMRTDLHEITTSVQELNGKIATVINDQGWQKERLGILEKRINKLIGGNDA